MELRINSERALRYRQLSMVTEQSTMPHIGQHEAQKLGCLAPSPVVFGT